MTILAVGDNGLGREALRGLFAELASAAATVEAPGSRQAMQRVAGHAELEPIPLDPNPPDRSGSDLPVELRDSRRGTRWPANSGSSTWSRTGDPPRTRAIGP